MTRRRRIIGIAIGALLLICLAAGGAAIALRGAASRITTQREKWEALGIDHYELTIERGAMQPCSQRIEVEDGQIVAVLGDTCGGTRSPLHIGGLFSLSEDYAELNECGPNGCMCDGPIGADVLYDDMYHFPVDIQIRTMPELRTRYPRYWLRPILGPWACTLIGFTGEHIGVTDFRVLP